MVWLHVVDHHIVYLAVAYHLAYVLDELCEEVYLHRVDEAHLVVDDKIGVVRHSVGQRPQALKQVLVAVVHAYIVDVVCY